MDTETLRTVAAWIGALGGLSGFSTLGYSIYRDHKAKERESEAAINVDLRIEGTGRLLTISTTPRDNTQNLSVKLTSIPARSLGFARAQWVDGVHGKYQEPADAQVYAFTMPLKRNMLSGVHATHVFVAKLKQKRPPQVRIKLFVTNTNKVVATTTRHIND